MNPEPPMQIHQAETNPRALRSQRWRERRQLLVSNQSVIDPREFAADVIPAALAKRFVETHHYSASFPASRLAIGLFRNGAAGRSRLVGVAVFSVPMNDAAVRRHTGLRSPSAGVDLGRFCLLDEVEANGETWMLARAFRLLRREKPGVEAVISYADPMPRISATGEIIKPGHVGLILQAHGGGSSKTLAYRGRSAARVEYLTPDARPFSPRAISKIRNGESGQAYGIDQLVRGGARPPRPAESARTWFDDLVRSGFFFRRRHPGNHVFAYALTAQARRAAEGLVSAPFPRLDPAVSRTEVTALPLFVAADKARLRGAGEAVAQSPLPQERAG